MAAMALLDHACAAATDLKVYGSSRADKELTQIALSPMARRGFMSAVADAARALNAIASSQSWDGGGHRSGQDEPRARLRVTDTSTPWPQRWLVTLS